MLLKRKLFFNIKNSTTPKFGNEKPKKIHHESILLNGTHIAMVIPGYEEEE